MTHDVNTVMAVELGLNLKESSFTSALNLVPKVEYCFRRITQVI